MTTNTTFPALEPLEWDDLGVTAIPIHPKSIFETVAVKLRGKGGRITGHYDHTGYEAQRQRRAPNVPEFKSRTTARMRSAGWSYSEEYGCLVAPSQGGEHR